MRKIIFLVIVFGLFQSPGVNAQVSYRPALAVPVLPQQNVKVVGRQLMTDFDGNGQYTPYLIKGVAYSSNPWGRFPDDWGYATYPADPRYNNPSFPNNILDDAAILDQDFALIQSMHGNTIRIWGGQDNSDPTQPGRFPTKITQRTLDKAEQYGLKVIAGFWMPHPGDWVCSNGGLGPRIYNYNTAFSYGSPTDRASIKQKFRNYVRQFKNHPAILFWTIGNEDNLHLRDAVHAQQFYSLVNEMAQEAHLEEGLAAHPVAAVSGDLGFIGQAGVADDASVPALDLWGMNVYRGASFGNLFTNYAAVSQKPLWISEFNSDDAWHTTDLQNPHIGYEDQNAQALTTYLLWQEIQQNYNSVLNRVTIGGSVMAFGDEWWQPDPWLCGANNRACNEQHDYFGQGPIDLSCPRDGTPDWYPPSADNFFNAEWWGIFARVKNPVQPNHDTMVPRLVYHALRLFCW
ncbi:MAG: hypothetical protein A2787_10285 [Omnitrophica WOR_2 bacterium RIFCSPHIGHO2_01_FULL_48_9]|nr:MAG: hypothetical protein A3D10_08185 [Omnitrophica WOR_2 bacterium RIFCSPHIGHO2_02_FULL_48_11]OGX29859.1 MAG: hypothetical protein A2787_10285 [Omnitrophica WOR_2 bacterium RIFCSPHIGHO2_01_FULL_48_9]